MRYSNGELEYLNHLHVPRESISFFETTHTYAVPTVFVKDVHSNFSHLIAPCYTVTLRCLPDRKDPYNPHS